MKTSTLLIGALVLAGSSGFVFADQAPSMAATANHASAKKTAHKRILKLRDRIKGQRERIEQGVKDNTLTMEQAKADRAVLKLVDDQMKAERQANGSKKLMRKEAYDAYNVSLDANSESIREEKRDFYYYGPYVDITPEYQYYYDAFQAPGAAVPSVSTDEETHPRSFELKERIMNQRERIEQGLAAGSLTKDEAASGRAVLNSVEDQMKADYKANGATEMKREQYNTYNASLDMNSAAIHEEKHPYYYYGPYYNQDSYWF